MFIAFVKVLVCSCTQPVEDLNIVFDPKERPNLSMPSTYIKGQLRYHNLVVNPGVLSVMNKPELTSECGSICPCLYLCRNFTSF